jgi:hypothetical protein
MNHSHMRWPLVFSIVAIATAASGTATTQKLEVAVKAPSGFLCGFGPWTQDPGRTRNLARSTRN